MPYNGTVGVLLLYCSSLAFLCFLKTFTWMHIQYALKVCVININAEHFLVSAGHRNANFSWIPLLDSGQMFLADSQKCFKKIQKWLNVMKMDEMSCRTKKGQRIAHSFFLLTYFRKYTFFCFEA